VSDKSVADIGRQLAEALQDAAYSRKPEDKKRVSDLNTALVRACKEEK
jgi:hypothetical protein